ncbi:RNA exonuclease 4-like [Rutidosis leptorrhynchoides]|uniref:RNA exonuclease 4-like n=1 Tax=Rutidosis leptorrhynchoides TaxID=125765 RepID=UPI003A9A1FBF
MSSEAKKKKKTPKPQSQLNPNWAQFQQKLKESGHGFNKNPKESRNSVLGRRKERPDDELELNDPKNNILAPVNDDCSLTDIVGMDCEMVGVGQGTKSALGRVTLINKWGNVLYDEFVRPVEWVVDFRTEISGIRPRDLKKAKDIRDVQQKVADLIKGRILVGHALRNDLKALLLTHPKKDLRDTAEYQPLLKERRRKALRHLAAEFLGVTIQNGEHCPVEDARVAMLLYQKHRKEWEKNAKDQIKLKQKQKKRKPKKKTTNGGDLTGSHATILSKFNGSVIDTKAVCIQAISYIKSDRRVFNSLQFCIKGQA